MDKVLIGHIGVDAGLCWIGDPCYILHKATPPIEIGTDWSDFCDKIENMKFGKSFNYDMGHEGLGVVVSTGYGDGEYPVYATIQDGQVKSVTVEFISDDEDTDDGLIDLG